MLVDHIYKPFFKKKHTETFNRNEKARLYFTDISGNISEPLLLQFILYDLKHKSKVDFNKKRRN